MGRWETWAGVVTTYAVGRHEEFGGGGSSRKETVSKENVYSLCSFGSIQDKAMCAEVYLCVCVYSFSLGKIATSQCTLTETTLVCVL